MKQELEEKIMKDFPWFEARNVWTNEKCGFPMPCSCGDGWFDLIYNICKELQEYYKSIGANINELRILQIKEKWGTLSFYIGNYYGEANKIIEKYKKISEITCECCGAEGTIKHRGSWLRTLCNKCGTEKGYIDFEDEEI